MPEGLDQQHADGHVRDECRELLALAFEHGGAIGDDQLELGREPPSLALGAPRVAQVADHPQQLVLFGARWRDARS